MFKLLCIFAFFFSLEIDGKFTFESVTLGANADYGQTSINIDKSPIGPVMNVNTNLTKKVFGKVFVKLNVFSFMQKRRRLILPIPKVNYCELQTGVASFPVLKNIYEEMEKYGNLTSPCPFECGNYYLKDLQFDDAKFVAMTAVFPEGKYIAHIHVTDENESQPISIVNLDVFVVYKKNKKTK